MWPNWKHAFAALVLGASYAVLAVNPSIALPVAPLDPQRDMDLGGVRLPPPPREADPLKSALDLVNAKKYDEAITRLRTFLKDHPNSAPGHEILGAALALKGNTDDGLKELQRAVALDPQRYPVEIDNAQVRVFRAKWGPRDKAPQHEHVMNRVLVFLTDGLVKMTAADGARQAGPQPAKDSGH